MTSTLTQFIEQAGSLETPWAERSYGKHSDTRHLDEVAIPVAVLLRREGYTPSPTSRQARRAG